MGRSGNARLEDRPSFAADVRLSADGPASPQDRRSLLFVSGSSLYFATAGSEGQTRMVRAKTEPFHQVALRRTIKRRGSADRSS